MDGDWIVPHQRPSNAVVSEVLTFIICSLYMFTLYRAKCFLSFFLTHSLTHSLIRLPILHSLSLLGQVPPLQVIHQHHSHHQHHHHRRRRHHHHHHHHRRRRRHRYHHHNSGDNDDDVLAYLFTRSPFRSAESGHARTEVVMERLNAGCESFLIISCASSVW